jgi:hypothetical protein
MSFWKMLKQGNDHFEVTRLEPKVDVCDRRYVFDAEPKPGARQPLRFNASAACPAYEVNAEVAEAVAEKRKSDDAQYAEYVRRNVSTVAVRTGRDGGMHSSFYAKLAPKAVRDADGTVRYEVDPQVARSLGSYVNPPKDPDNAPASTGSVLATGPRSTTMSLASAESRPAPKAAAAAPEQSTFSRFSRWVGLSSDEPQTQQQAQPKAAPTPKARTAAAPAPKAKPQTEPAPEQPMRTMQATAAPTSAPASNPSLLSGATPVVPSDSFSNRFGTFR